MLVGSPVAGIPLRDTLPLRIRTQRMLNSNFAFGLFIARPATSIVATPHCGARSFRLTSLPTKLLPLAVVGGSPGVLIYSLIGTPARTAGHSGQKLFRERSFVSLRMTSGNQHSSPVCQAARADVPIRGALGRRRHLATDEPRAKSELSTAASRRQARAVPMIGISATGLPTRKCCRTALHIYPGDIKE